MGLPQIVELIVAAGGRRYDLKTIGRALAGLAADEVIVYRPAQGRGARAFIAIHDRFVGDIEVLGRDRSGRVIVDYSSHSDPDSVTFSEPPPYKDQKIYPPTPRNANAAPGLATDWGGCLARRISARCCGVCRSRWRGSRSTCGGCSGGRSASAWKPGGARIRILGVLAAPMPADVERPWRLALWRLRHNVVGSGPRLRPLQQAWDAQAGAASRAAAEDTTGALACRGGSGDQRRAACRPAAR